MSFLPHYPYFFTILYYTTTLWHHERGRMQKWNRCHYCTQRSGAPPVSANEPSHIWWNLCEHLYKHTWLNTLHDSVNYFLFFKLHSFFDLGWNFSLLTTRFYSFTVLLSSSTCRQDFALLPDSSLWKLPQQTVQYKCYQRATILMIVLHVLMQMLYQENNVNIFIKLSELYI